MEKLENVTKHRDIKLATTDKRKNQLGSEPSYHTTKYFSENLIAIEMKKTKVKINIPIYLGISILDISKTLMYEFWYDYIKPKYQDKSKLCYMNTNSFIIHIKTEDFFEDIGNDVEKLFGTNYDENDKKPLPIGKNKKLVFLKMNQEERLRKNLLDSYLMVDDSGHKKPKRIKKCVIKPRLMVKNHRYCLFNNKIILKLQQRFKSYHQNVYTEQINKISLSGNDDKRLQIFDKIPTYPYGTTAFKVCESEMLSKT